MTSTADKFVDTVVAKLHNTHRVKPGSRTDVVNDLVNNASEDTITAPHSRFMDKESRSVLAVAQNFDDRYSFMMLVRTTQCSDLKSPYNKLKFESKAGDIILSELKGTCLEIGLVATSVHDLVKTGLVNVLQRAIASSNAKTVVLATQPITDTLASQQGTEQSRKTFTDYLRLALPLVAFEYPDDYPIMAFVKDRSPARGPGASVGLDGF